LKGAFRQFGVIISNLCYTLQGGFISANPVLTKQ